jgi:hypothetical protein
MDNVVSIKYNKNYDICDTYIIEDTCFFSHIPNENENKYNCLSFMRYVFPHIKCISTEKISIEDNGEGKYIEMPEYCSYNVNNDLLFDCLLETNKHKLLDMIEKNKIVYAVLHP